MELTHKFTVPASIDATWGAFNDIEGVAGCFPGASVSSVEGDEFKGSVKVKLGPISLTYNGSGSFVEKDESARRFVVEAKGKDRRGNGTASATVTATMASSSEAATDVEVLTDLTITGRPAQFGRGVIQDVSDKLLQQFMDCLEQKVGGGPTSEAAAAPEAPEGPARPTPEAEQGQPAPEAPAPEEAAEAEAAEAEAAVGREAAGPEVSVSGGPMGDGAGPAVEEVVTAPPTAGAERVDALDLGATVLPVLARRYWKSALAAVAGLVGLVVLVRLIRRR